MTTTPQAPTGRLTPFVASALERAHRAASRNLQDAREHLQRMEDGLVLARESAAEATTAEAELAHVLDVHRRAIAAGYAAARIRQEVAAGIRSETSAARDLAITPADRALMDPSTTDAQRRAAHPYAAGIEAAHAWDEQREREAQEREARRCPSCGVVNGHTGGCANPAAVREA